MTGRDLPPRARRVTAFDAEYRMSTDTELAQKTPRQPGPHLIQVIRHPSPPGPQTIRCSRPRSRPHS